ncbi:MAG: hypothetical protein LUG93_17505 [Lachnospiraceae bacterium]|nr:hypothetical protein [Lachnospiraceae bacterium]
MSAKIKILMVGGRRAGKTSILASMIKCAQEVTAATSIAIGVDSGAGDLSFKQAELESYFMDYEEGESFEPDLSPNNDDKQYEFSVKVNGRNTGFQLAFTDIPGEWLVSEPQKVDSLLSESAVVIIAVDSPHLMEKEDKKFGYGRYHKEFNRVDELTNYFKSGLQGGNSKIAGRLVIFVPIKCEKYFWLTTPSGKETDAVTRNNQMMKLNEKIKAGYRELFDHFSTPALKNVVSVAIAPVITIGGAEFYRFRTESYVGEYCFVMDPAKRAYAPRYCEQPLLLVLDFLLKTAADNKRKQNIFARLYGNLTGMAGLADLQSCEAQISKMINSNPYLGFERLQ